MDRSNLAVYGSFLLALLMLVLAVALLRPALLPLSLISQHQHDEAMQGVSSNGNWQPVRRRAGWHSYVLVPAGCFRMGSTDEQLEAARRSCEDYYGAFGCQQDFSDEQPAREVCFSRPYWIGRTEVINWQYAIRMGLGSLDYQYSNLSWPRSAVSWQDAVQFCQSIGARLPTEAEWEFAARGPDSLIYPFGDSFVLEKATLRKISPPPAGQITEGGSWVGALDMSGGMAEWVADEHRIENTDNATEPGERSIDYRLVKGGSWFAHAAYSVRAAARQPLAADTMNSTVGFRCVRQFEP